MREAIIRLIIPDTWIKDISHRYPVDIKCIECIPYGKNGGRGLFEIKGDEECLNKIVEEIKKHPTVAKVDVCTLKEGVIIGNIFSQNCVARRAITESNCYLFSGTCMGDGSIEWNVITGDEGSLSVLVKKLIQNGCKVDMKNSNKINKRALLTQRQENIVQIAFEQGYYDYPKKITIKDLSKSFGISASTLGEILQRGEKKIMFEHFRKFHTIFPLLFFTLEFLI